MSYPRSKNQTFFLSHAAVITLFFAILIIISYFYWDKAIAEYFHKKTIFKGFSLFIDYLFYPTRDYLYFPLAFFIIRFLFKKKELGNIILFLTLSIVTTNTVCNIIKWFAGRDRPELYFSHNIFGFVPFNSGHLHHSFPSGHACTIAAVFLSLACLYPKHSFLFLIVSFLLSFTRVLLEAHFLSDILAGIWLGMALSQLVYLAMRHENITFHKS